MNNIQQLYQTILKSGLINVSFDDFSKAMLNENYQKTVFENITQRGLFNNNFDVFKLAYSPQDDVAAVADIGAVKQLQPGDPGYKEPVTTVKEKLAIGAYSMVSAVNGIADYANAVGTNVEVFLKELDGIELTLEQKQDIFAKNKTANVQSELLEAQLFNYIGREGGTISNAIKEGKYGEAANKTVDGMIEAIPSLIAARLGPWGMVALGVSTAGNKFEQELFSAEEDANVGNLLLNATGSGAIEAGFEIVTRNLLKRANLISDQTSAQAAKEFLKEGVLAFGKKVIGSGLAEGFAESATALVSNYFDAYTLNKQRREGQANKLSSDIATLNIESEFIQEIGDSFIVGSAVGKSIASAGGLNKLNPKAKERAYNTLMEANDQGALNEIAKEASVLQTAYNKAKTEKSKKVIKDQMLDLVAKANRIKGNNKLTIDAMTDEQLDEYVQNIESQIEIKRAYRTATSEEEKKVLQNRFNSISNEIESTRESARVKVLEDYANNVKEYSDDIGATFERYGENSGGVEAFQKRYDELIEMQLQKLQEDFAAGKITKKKYDEDLKILNEKKGQDVREADGIFEGGVQLMNDVVAKKTGAVSVSSHEFLHNIIGKKFDNLTTQQKINLNKSFYNLLTDSQKAAVKKRFVENNEDIDGDVNFESEEMFTYFSDAMDKKEISFDEGFGSKIKNFSEEVLRLVGRRGEFENGRQAYNFLKTYHKTIKKGKRSKRITKFAEQDKIEVGETTQTKASLTRISEKASEIQSKVDAIGQKAKTKAEFDAGPNIEAYNYLIDGDGLTGLIKARLAKQGIDTEGEGANVNGVPMADYIEDVKAKLIPDVLGFNPEKETTSQGKFGLSGYINQRLNFRMGDVAKAAKKTVTGRSLDAPIDDSGRTAAELVEGEADPTLAKLEEENLGFLYVNSQNRSQESEQDKNELKSRYRHKLKNNDGSKLIGEPQVESVREGVRTALRKLKADVTASKFLLNFENMVKKTMKNIVQRSIGSGASYRQFVLNNFEAIIDFSTVQDLVAMERLVGKGKLKEGKKIFTVPIRRLTTQEDIQKAIDQGKLPADAINKSEEGVFLSEKRMPTQEELQAFFFGVDMQEVLGYELGASTLGTRKDGLSRMIVTELSQDAMMETMQEPDIMEELISANPDVAVQVMVNDVAVKINRAPSLKFSETAKQKQIQKGLDILVKEAKGLESSDFKAYAKETDKETVNQVTETFEKRKWETFIQSDKLITQAELDAIDNDPRYRTKDGKKLPLHRKYEIIAGNRLRAKIKNTPGLLKEGYIVEHPSETDSNQDIRVLDANNNLVLAIEVKGDTARGISVSLNYVDGKIKSNKNLYGKEQQAIEKAILQTFQNIEQVANEVKPGSVTKTRVTKKGTPEEKGGNMRIEKDVVNSVIRAGNNIHLDAHDIKQEITFEQVLNQYEDKTNTKGDSKISHAIEFKGRGLFDISMDKASLKIEGLTKAKDIDVKVPLRVRIVFTLNKAGTYYTVSARVEPQLAAYHLPTQNASLLTKANVENVKIKASKSKKLSVAQNITKASDQARTQAYFSKTKGASIFDFDETVGISKNVIIATKEGVTKEIQSDQWPFVGEDLANQGYEFDFTDFNKVTKGKPGPLLPKMKNQIKKYGPDNVFILTARAPESAEAIHAWLKSEGVNIPLENITGLGNSTGEAKAMWVLDKYANEGYNDMYFVDDAITNVQAVQNIFDQLDIKGKSVQAKIKFSRTKKQNFDSILKRNLGVDQDIDPARAKIIGAKKGKREFFIAPGADDFQGLMMRLAGQGKQGESDIKFFKQVFFDPFNRAYRKLNSIQYNMMEGYNKVRKQHKDVIKILKKKFDSEFTNEDAIRIYLWDLQDIEVPGLTTKEQKAIAAKVAQNADMVSFALDIRKTLQLSGEYVAPKETWSVGSIKGDMYEALNSVHRNKALQEWQENIDELLDNPEMLAKLEASMGKSYVEALKDMLYRMRTGKNRPTGPNAMANKAMNWLQGAVGAIMFFNSRSAVLQTISTVNFINHTDNNIFAFAKAIANVKQFAEDFKMLFNSPQLKVRRSGLQQDIQTADLADSLSRGGNASSALAYLLKIGFTPTQIADSFAIAFGGAAFYRNRVNSLMKQGMTQEQAESQAMIDFQDITEESQQSSRPDRISQQQAAPVGRLLLAFQNTPLQYNRIIKKAITDIANKRGDIKTHISRIAYYGAIQSLIFYSLQQALFAEDDPEEEEVPSSVKREYKTGIKDGTIDKIEYPNVTFYYKDTKARQKQESLVNSMADSWLRGSGVKGAIVSTFKNVIRSFMKESEKGYKADYFNTFIEVLNVSPQIGSKARKIKKASDTYKYNKEVMSEIGAFDIDNPVYPMTFSLIEGVTNAPVHRIYTKLDNLKEAFNEDNTAMQRLFVSLGWNQWQLGIDTYKDIREAKEKIKERKKAKKKQCRQILKNGKRCSIRTTNKSQLCYHHD